MSRMLFIGIDPGVHGAVAVIDQESRPLIVERFPISQFDKAPRKRNRKNRKTGEMERVTVRGKRTELNFAALATLFNQISMLGGEKRILLEWVSAMPTDSTTSAFTFGGSFWALRQAMADRELDYHLIKPREWQNGILGGIKYKDRDELRDAYLDKARALFPNIDLHRKKDAEPAAALLIAEYCRVQFIHNAAHLLEPDDVVAPGY